MEKDQNTSAVLERENAKLREQLDVVSAQFHSTAEALQKSERENRRLVESLQALLRRIYGRRSEKLDAGQLLLFAQTESEEPAPEPTPPHALEAPDDEEVPSHHRRRLRPRIPSNLEKQRIVLPVPESDKICPQCRIERKCIGEDIQEKLDFVPARFVCKQYVRLKFACARCQEGVVRAPAVITPIEKGIPDTGLLAQVAVSKYQDHLPLERQSKIYERSGVSLSVSTLCDWIGSMAKCLVPIYEAQKELVLQDFLVQTDDTPVLVVQNFGPANKQRRIRGYFWPYLGRCEVVFDFTLSRSRDGPFAFLQGFQGYLQTDAYAGYHQVQAVDGIVAVGCMAHARRRFFEALRHDPHPASLPMALIRLLYHIERDGTDLRAEERRALRQEKSRPVLDHLHQSLLELKPVVLPKSKLGEAVGYALAQWETLTRYLEDGRIPIDNNAVEQIIRPVAIGRKNWLFAGSPEGGKRAAILYSMIASCKLHGISPTLYFEDVLRRVKETPADRMQDLVPSRWKSLAQS